MMDRGRKSDGRKVPGKLPHPDDYMTTTRRENGALVVVPHGVDTETTAPQYAPLSRQPPEKVFDLLFSRSRPGGYIAVGARRPGKDGTVAPRFWTVLPALRYQPLLPHILEAELDMTKYFCPNVMDEKALHGKDPRSYMTAVVKRTRRPEYYAFKNHHVRELGAVWVDLDVGRRRETMADGEYMTNAQVFGLIMYKMASGQLPWPSLAAVSGRGSYYLWLLKEPDTLAPPLVTDETKLQWQLVIEETIRRTTDLQSDPNARRLAQWLKMPGTVDTKTGREVVYLSMGMGAPGNVPLHTLDQLMAFYDLRQIAPAPRPAELPGVPGPRPEKRRRPKNTGSSRSRAPSRKRFYEMQALASYRGGFPEGYRHNALLIYFSELRNYFSRPPDSMNEAGSFSAATAKVAEFNARYCRPPLPPAEVGHCCPRNRPRRPMRASELTRRLRVTEEEALALDLVALRPPALRSSVRKAKERAQSEREKERDLILAGLAAGMAPFQVIHGLAQQGIKVSKQRVYYWRRVAKSRPPGQPPLPGMPPKIPSGGGGVKKST